MQRKPCVEADSEAKMAVTEVRFEDRWFARWARDDEYAARVHVMRAVIHHRLSETGLVDADDM
jgi:hypothetical protein